MSEGVYAQSSLPSANREKGIFKMPACQYCHEETDDRHTLCAACELRLMTTLIRLTRDLTPLRDSLDATLHPGGHSPVRVQTANPPTPLRLDVLDLIDLLDATLRGFLRCLDGVDAREWRNVRAQPENIWDLLVRAAAHPMLARTPMAGMYMREILNLARRVDQTLDPPEERREIGTCETCATMLTAGSRDQWVTCPVCGDEQRVQTVKLRRLKTLCWDDSKRGSAADVARAFTDAGITVRRNTITQWASRGKLTATPDGYAYCDVYRLVMAGEGK